MCEPVHGLNDCIEELTNLARVNRKWKCLPMVNVKGGSGKLGVHIVNIFEVINVDYNKV